MYSSLISDHTIGLVVNGYDLDWGRLEKRQRMRALPGMNSKKILFKKPSFFPLEY